MWYSEEDWYNVQHSKKENDVLNELVGKTNPNPFDDSKVERLSKDIIELLQRDEVLMEEFIKRFNPILRRKKLNKLKTK